MAPQHIEYFKLKEFETTAEAYLPLPPPAPLRQGSKEECKQAGLGMFPEPATLSSHSDPSYFSVTVHYSSNLA